MSKAGVNEVLAILCAVKAGEKLTVPRMCNAIDARASSAYRSPLWRAVHGSLGILRRHGYVAVIDYGPSQNAEYFATAEGRTFHKAGTTLKHGHVKGKPRTGPQILVDPFRDRLWTALRVKRRGTLPELVQAAARDEDRNAVKRAREFLNSLARADIVIAQGRNNKRARARGAAKQSRLITYILSRDLGPKTPAPQRDCLFDPNAQERIAYPEAAHG